LAAYAYVDAMNLARFCADSNVSTAATARALAAIATTITPDDVADLLSAFGFIDANAPTAWPPYAGDALAVMPEVPIEWLPMLGRDGFLVSGRSHLVSAFPKLGKTELLVRCVREWLALGHEVTYLTEESPATWARRLQSLGGQASDWQSLTVIPALGMPVGDMLADAFHYGPSVVIVDTVRSLLGIVDENDSAQMARAVQPWIAAARRNGDATLIAVHHARKGGGDFGEAVSGGHGLIAAFDVVIELSRERDVQGAENGRRVITAYGRGIDRTTETYEKRGAEFHIADNAQTIALPAARRRILDELSTAWQTTRAIHERLTVPPVPSLKTVSRALSDLAKDALAQSDAPAGGPVAGHVLRWRIMPPDIAERGPLAPQSNLDNLDTT